MSKEEKFIQWLKIVFLCIFLTGAIWLGREIHFIRLILESYGA